MSLTDDAKAAVRTVLDLTGRACVYVPGDGSASYAVTLKVREGFDVEDAPPEQFPEGFGQARWCTVLAHADDLSADPVAGFDGNEDSVTVDGVTWRVRGMQPHPQSLAGVAWKLWCSTAERWT